MTCLLASIAVKGMEGSQWWAIVIGANSATNSAKPYNLFQFKFVLLWPFGLVLGVTVTPFGVLKFDRLFDFAMKAYVYFFIAPRV